MRVAAIRRFRDIGADRLREEGEEFDVTPRRFEEINSTKYGVLVKQVEGADDGEDANQSDGGEGNPPKRPQRRKTAKSE